MKSAEGYLQNAAKSGHRKRAISPILATIILIIITVVAGVMLYGFVTGFFSSTATSMDANVQAQLTVPSGSQFGTFVVSIKNAGTVSIKGVNITLYGSDGAKIAEASIAGLDVAPGQSASFTATGNSGWTASSGTLESGSSYLNATSVVSGSGYNYVVQVYFANGGVKTYTGSVTASSF